MARNRTKGPVVSGNAREVAGKTVAAKAQKPDRRVRRTRDALGDAMVALMHEKPFDEIKVQHVLDRAGVSRSTFYTQYSDTNDLLLSEADELFAWMSTLLLRGGEASERVAPVREMFAHVAEMRTFLASLTASGKFRETMELAQRHFASAIEKRLAQLPRARGIAKEQRPVMAAAFAGALLSLLTWWLNRGKAISPERMDQDFHHLVWSGVGTPAPRSQPAVAGAPRAKAMVGDMAG